MLLDTDLPYLEPLLFWLKKDEKLKLLFSRDSFFMPHSNLITATEEAMKKDCPAPRALWILPQDTLAVNQREGCDSQGRHTFYIEIITQCIRDQFQIIKNGDEAKLTGQFMELAALRKAVKKSVNAFAKENMKETYKKYENIFWVKDQMLYPTEANNFLATAIQYEIKIF